MERGRLYIYCCETSGQGWWPDVGFALWNDSELEILAESSEKKDILVPAEYVERRMLTHLAKCTLETLG